MRAILAFASALLLAAPLAAQTAFPGAATANAHMTACRDGRPIAVHFVTNLATSPSTPGSMAYILANDVSSANYDFVLFDVGGTTDGTANVGPSNALTDDCVYLAGQTAEGDGFAIRQDENNGVGPIKIGNPDANDPANDVIYRGILMLKDTCPGGMSCGSQVPWVVFNGQRVVIADCEMYGGEDQVFSLYAGRNSGTTGLQDVTVQWCIINPTWSQTTGIMISQGIAGTGSIEGIIFHQNAMMHRHRWPRLFASNNEPVTPNYIGSVVMHNNGIVCPQTRGLEIAAVVDTLSYIKNYLQGCDGYTSVPDALRIASAVSDSAGQGNVLAWRLYVECNIYRSQHTNCSDDAGFWSGYLRDEFTGSPVPEGSNRLLTRPGFPAPSLFPEELDPLDLRDKLYVDQEVGVRRLLNANGTWRAVTNNWQDFYLDAARDSSLAPLPGGLSPLQMADHPLGGWPTLPTVLSGPADTDSDGCPDEYEKAITGNPADSLSWDCTSTTPLTSGYYRLEAFANGKHPACTAEEMESETANYNATPFSSGCPGSAPVQTCTTPTYLSTGACIHWGKTVREITFTPDTINPDSLVPDTVYREHPDSVRFVDPPRFYSRQFLADVPTIGTDVLVATSANMWADSSLTQIDSATVDSLCAANGRSGCPGIIMRLPR